LCRQRYVNYLVASHFEDQYIPIIVILSINFILHSRFSQSFKSTFVVDAIAMVRKVVNNCIKYILRNAFRLRIRWPLVLFYSNIIKVVKPKNGSVPQDKPTILALTPYRFRGDLNVLSDSRQFRVLELPFEWQVKLLGVFWPSNISEIRSEQYYRTSGNDKDV